MTYTKDKKFYAEQRRWYKKLEEEGFYDIESGLDSPPMLKPVEYWPLNTIQAEAGRPMVHESGSGRGREWEELISTQDRNVDYAKSHSARYTHFAQLIASQEYALCRLGNDLKAQRTRAAWSMHALGYSERYIAQHIDASRYEIRSYLAHLYEVILHAVDTDPNL